MALVVGADQQRVLERAGVEVAFEMVVQRVDAVARERAVERARQDAFADRVCAPAARDGEEVGPVVAVVVLVLRVAEVLAEGEVLVELVLEQPAEGLALAVVIVARLADEAAGRQAPVRVRQDRAFPREELRAGAALLLLI